jgi:hypothetical protein
MLYKCITNSADVELLQIDLDNVSNWCKENGMKLNADKSRIIAFGQKGQPPPSYHINNIEIPLSSSIKYLGIHINANLKWNDHITYILNKSNKILGLIKATLTNAPINVKRLAYFTLCRPILEYGCEVWDPTSTELVEKLEVFQNKAVRFIYNIRGRETSMTEIKCKQNICTLAKRRKEIRQNTFMTILEYDHLHPTLSSTLNSMLTANSTLTVSTRNQSLNPVYCRTNTLLNSFIMRTARDLRLGGGNTDTPTH